MSLKEWVTIQIRGLRLWTVFKGGEKMSENKALAVRVNLWINNEDVATNHYRQVVDPGKLSDIVGEVAQGDPSQVDLAVRSAHQAFQSWKKTDLEYRSQLLLKAADILQNSAEKYASILARESGMLIANCLAEFHAGANSIRSTVKLAQDFLKPKRVEDENTWISVEKVPLGVIAAIIPWNVAIGIAMSKLAPILITGNTVVLKPSPTSSMAVSLVLRDMSKLFPPGVINIVHGEVEVGEALTKHPYVRKVTLTGGDKTAVSIMKAVADNLTRVHFELGGNDPAIILDDADLEKVLPQIATLVFRRSGQVCVAVKRIYVPDKLYQDACDIFSACVDRYKIGHSLNREATMGPVNNGKQYQYVKDLIARAKEKATVLELGTKLEPENWENGYYIQPTVVLDAQNDDEIVQAEQFGPVVPLIRYQDEEEVIAMANNTEYGLGSSVWTSDFERGLRVARQLEAGCTGINGSIDSPLGVSVVPFGGVKRSGIGWERGEAGLNEFVNTHGITYHKNL